MTLTILAVAPGVIVHELGHLLLCLLSGVAVRQVVLFRIGSPAGFVAHAAPRLLRQHLAISSGPLILASALALSLFVLVLRLISTRPGYWWPLAALIGIWLGWSIALEAWPSSGDAAALRRSATLQLRQLNPGATLALPLAWLLLLVNAARRLRAHWLYAGLLAVAAYRLTAI
jgi:hypothetical protein